MTSLDPVQASALLDASDKIGGAFGFQERMGVALDAVRALLPSTGSTAGLLKLERRRATTVRDQIYTSGCPEERYLAYVRDMIRVDPMRPRIEAATGKPERLSDYLQSCTPGFERFLRDAGVRHLLGWSFPVGDGNLLVVALLRSEALPDFSAGELQPGEVAGRLLARAARLTSLTNLTHAALARGQELGPVVAADAAGELLHIDVGAEAALRLGETRGRDLIAGALTGKPQPGRPGTAPRLRLVDLSPGSASRLFAVEVQQPSGRFELSKFKLAPRQQQVAALLLDGLTYDQIACQLQIGLSSVKRAVEAIYFKAGVPSRAALSQLVQRRRSTRASN